MSITLYNSKIKPNSTRFFQRRETGMLSLVIWGDIGGGFFVHVVPNIQKLIKYKQNVLQIVR